MTTRSVAMFLLGAVNGILLYWLVHGLPTRTQVVVAEIILLVGLVLLIEGRSA